MRFHIKVEAFGYTFEKEWGSADHTAKILEGAVTILTVGITFQLYA